MAFVLARIVSDHTSPTLVLETVDALYMDGHAIDEHVLDGVPFRVTLDEARALRAIMTLDEGIRRQLRIARDEAETDATEHAARLDIFAVDPDMHDDDGIILRTHLPAKEQTFRCNTPIVLDGQPLTLPQ